MIAYFTMEIGLEPAMPTYAGGLGILAGDTVRSAADLRLAMVAVSLVHRKGYFHQRLDRHGRQSEEPVQWVVEDFLEEMGPRVAVNLEGRDVLLRAWKYEVQGISGNVLPVYFLDTDLPENSDADRELTHFLYGGDSRYRLSQEVVLGIGGVRMLRALGYDGTTRFHMNEGHSSLLTLELLREQALAKGRSSVLQEDIDHVRSVCVFTTHTPVPSGHDRFPMELASRVVGQHRLFELKERCCFDGQLNLTYLALNLSRYVNGVAMSHGEVSKRMFAGYAIDAITNGVHPPTWVAEPFRELYDRYIPGWRLDNFSLRYALSIPGEAIRAAHRRAKRHLIERVNHETNAGFDLDVVTLGFARRATSYKRADLLLQDPERLLAIAAQVGPLQVVYAGKAHPQDAEGKKLIEGIFQIQESLKDRVKIAYLENYEMDLARNITSGVDVWLNTPEPPLEASGTSGMKAALNGVPSLSVMDGWWVEGHIEGLTGWSIGEPGDARNSSREDAGPLYEKLEGSVVPTFYRQPDRFVDIMRHAIALNGSFFHTQRMLQEYLCKAYNFGTS
ncbi:MAG TPA: alpha-glucan family phosphorylase [Vicinamibacteria bacterium]|nr:alpha-glucan family phosphorylase [Vicinamibacteria bacterium]